MSRIEAIVKAPWPLWAQLAAVLVLAAAAALIWIRA